MISKRVCVFSILTVCICSLIGTPISFATTTNKICNGNTQCNNTDGCRNFGFGLVEDKWYWMGKCVYSPDEGDSCAMTVRDCHETITYSFSSCSGAVIGTPHMDYQSGCR